jgi:hypothetical protein
MERRKKDLGYYVICYIPYAYEIDKWVKNKVLQRIKRKMQKRNNQ